VVSFKYQLNSASQRTAITNADGSHWRYGYDSLGQVTSGNKHWADGSSVAGQQFGYQFDDIGNRKSASVAGGESGLTMRDLGYTANVLNQYEKRDISRWIPQSGTANDPSTVTLNDKPTVRQGDYYWGEVYAENSTGPAWLGITNLGVLNDGTNPDVVTGYEGHKYAPKTPEAFTHDDDGNLTTDGRWTYTWDAADRLVGISILSTINSQQSTFFYDGLGRRVQMLETTNGVTASDKRFVWVSTELAEERDATGALVTKRFFGQGEQQWSMIDNQPVCQNFYYTRDHLGSVREMTDVGGVVRARYEYDPYGVRSKVSGDLDADFGFTGHYYHAPSGLQLALYRAYDAGTGRWLSRDPIAEKGGLNLYAYCRNNPLNAADSTGFEPIPVSYYADEFSRLAKNVQALQAGITQSELTLQQLKAMGAPQARECGYSAYWLWNISQAYRIGQLEQQLSQMKSQLPQAKQAAAAALAAYNLAASGGVAFVSGLMVESAGTVLIGGGAGAVGAGVAWTGVGAAAVGGAALGYGVGKISIKEQTIHEWIGSGLYYMCPSCFN
jgi:RHS repeat-associated protein